MTTAELVRSVSPQRPDDVVVEAPAATPAQVEEAADRARLVHRHWWGSQAAVRSGHLGAAAAALRGRSQEAAELVVREVGKPVGEATAEVARAVAILEYYAQAAYAPLGEVLPPSAPGLLLTERRPHGVAGLVTPWNFPLAIPLWKAAPAMVAGNAVLLKPSPDATAIALWLQDLFADALPPFLFQVLPGAGATGRAVLEQADVVSFTGSVDVGHQVAVAAAERGVPVQAEMGGQNAAIVLPDADAGATAAMVAGAAMGYAGQKCTATRRVVVVGGERRVDEVTQALVAAVRGLEPGDPAEPGVSVGPVITPAAVGKVVDGAQEATSAGGRVLAGGTAGDPLGDGGWFVAPTLVDGLEPDHRLVREETFGPLAVVQAARDVADAVRIAEQVRYGLVTSVHGRDLGDLLAAARGVRSGLVKVNAPTTGVDFWAPFGGEKASSYGPREQGTAALAFYASTRTITLSVHP